MVPHLEDRQGAGYLCNSFFGRDGKGHADTLPNITIIGPGAGRREIGQAILTDMLAIAFGRRSLFSPAGD
ncbi:MAG: hypothetical protein VB045_03045 [Synergistaceae bacterium]|nr:hypothetical protein [Synergistaceae bacterium]